ncbi:MAG: hypothetical protein Q9214_000345, partial [Letrouitia sp. 1 TL-2023]
SGDGRAKRECAAGESRGSEPRLTDATDKDERALESACLHLVLLGHLGRSCRGSRVEGRGSRVMDPIALPE